jgi:hypothetical protein
MNESVSVHELQKKDGKAAKKEDGQFRERNEQAIKIR